MKKIIFGDILFIFQLTLAIVFGFSQLVHMLTVSTNGLSTSTFLFTTIFVAINLQLSLASYKIHKNKEAKQTVVIYITGVVVYGSWVLIMLFKSQDVWNKVDSFIFVLVSILIILIAAYTKVKNIPLFDPLAKGAYGLVMRAIPHTALALKIYHDGNGGLSIVTIVLFHVLTISRIFQIFRKYKTTWNRNKTGLAIAEIGNEISWLFVTTAYIL